MEVSIKPFFSVIIPTFNRINELKKCLHSVLGQNESSFEVIVIDDRSTDGTKEWLLTINDNRLKILSNRRTKGACGARNTGIDAANGEWIAFLDSDDWWEHNKLEAIFKCIIENKEYMVFYSGCYYVNSRGEEAVIKMPGVTGNIQNYLGRLNPIRGFSGLVVNKNAIVKAGAFDEELPARQDIDLYYRLSLHHRFYYIPETLVYISFQAHNKITFDPYKRLMGWMMVYKKHRSLMNFWDRRYQQKRIVGYAWKAKRPDIIIKHLPGAFLAFAENMLTYKTRILFHK